MLAVLFLFVGFGLGLFVAQAFAGAVGKRHQGGKFCWMFDEFDHIQ
jgi:hypothetical protein